MRNAPVGGILYREDAAPIQTRSASRNKTCGPSLCLRNSHTLACHVGPVGTLMRASAVATRKIKVRLDNSARSPCGARQDRRSLTARKH